MNKKYFQNIDGLRAYAAIAVILYHLNLHFGESYYFHYGYLGVQLFFVISGFLITNILIGSKNTKNYFGQFYIRRSLRIFPLYFICLAFAILYGFLNNIRIDDIVWYITFLQNWIIGYTQNNPGFPAIFGHSWTIAIEQQFYIFWPFAIRYLNMRYLAILCIGGILGSMVLRIYFQEIFTGSISAYSTISHIDTLFGGSLLAIIYNNKNELQRSIKYILFIALFCLCLYFLGTKVLGIDAFWTKNIRTGDREWPTMMIAITPIMILIVHYLLISKNRIISLFFGNSWITYLGKISYGIYLYHIFILYLFDNTQIEKSISLYVNLGLVHILDFFIADLNVLFSYSIYYTQFCIILFKIILIILIAHFSYKYFESRFLKHKMES